MMGRLRLALGILAVCSFAALNVYLLATPAPQLPRVPSLQAPRPDGGLPAQRQRIDKIIDSVAAMDYAQLVEDLSQYNERFEVAQAAGLSSAITGVSAHTLRQVLADRRAMKLYELLQSSSAEEQKRAPLKLFRAKMQLHRELCAKPLNESLAMSEANYHALNVALFLCAMFCDPDDVVAECDEWVACDDAVGVVLVPSDEELDLEELTESSDPVVPGPDMLFVASVYTIMLTERNLMPEDILRQRVVDLRETMDFALPPLVKFNLYRTSAHTTELDFLHRHRAVSPDSSALAATIIGFDDWERGGLLWRLDKTKVAAQKLRSWVTQSATAGGK